MSLKIPKKDYKPLIIILLIIFAICFIFVFNAYAHKGKTDSNGGHRDNNNVSGLGSYHFHCGGYPAHLHTNGCPYTSTSSNQVEEDDFDQEEYDAGYEDGYSEGKSEAYYKGHGDGYDAGYELGKEKQEKANIKERWITISISSVIILLLLMFYRKK